jgi:hypothetical protein
MQAFQILISYEKNNKALFKFTPSFNLFAFSLSICNNCFEAT